MRMRQRHRLGDLRRGIGGSRRLRGDVVEVGAVVSPSRGDGECVARGVVVRGDGVDGVGVGGEGGFGLVGELFSWMVVAHVVSVVARVDLVAVVVHGGVAIGDGDFDGGGHVDEGGGVIVGVLVAVVDGIGWYYLIRHGR